ncbi:hypothetical protein [Thermoflavimicrobium daqui]|uniref:Uncharacterized protein n=1 Tax=Thermoflavimicrobium daqui TaxID=2137476 RepID=A0A364K2M9_9BACL|nr:hypothetical protein [Thermoflavimicrobium daqui]RAL22559.1 hypothetical protein DL897_14200 [Thermoflavimicrobium daqui]
MDLRPEEAFMLGYKPACTCQKGNLRLKPYFDRLLEGKYPNYRFNDLEAYIFFRTEEEKEQFVQDMKSVELYSVEYVIKLGTVLGIPPKSINFFAKYWESDYPKGKIGVNCSGIVFATHVDILIEEVEYLWNKYRNTRAEEYPTIVEIGNNEYRYVINYGDVLELYSVAQDVSKIMSGKVTA